MTEDISNRTNIKILKVFPSFILGKCRCNCGNDLKSLRSSHRVLQYYLPYHYSVLKKNNGITIGRKGYIVRYCKDYELANKKGFRRENRYKYEIYYKCCLLSWIDIHHINGDKTDNRIENLQPIPHGKHTVLTHEIDMSGRKCILCGSEKTYLHTRNNRPVWYNYNSGLICHKCYTKLKYQRKKKLVHRAQYLI